MHPSGNARTPKPLLLRAMAWREPIFDRSSGFMGAGARRRTAAPATLSRRVRDRRKPDWVSLGHPPPLRRRRRLRLLARGLQLSPYPIRRRRRHLWPHRSRHGSRVRFHRPRVSRMPGARLKEWYEYALSTSNIGDSSRAPVRARLDSSRNNSVERCGAEPGERLLIGLHGFQH
jgi:hypothetical protein